MSLPGGLSSCGFSPWGITEMKSPESLPPVFLSAPYSLPFFSLLDFPVLLSSCECLDCRPKSFLPVHQQISGPVPISHMTLSCLATGTLAFSIHQVQLECLPPRWSRAQEGPAGHPGQPGAGNDPGSIKVNFKDQGPGNGLQAENGSLCF